MALTLEDLPCRRLGLGLIWRALRGSESTTGIVWKGDDCLNEFLLRAKLSSLHGELCQDCVTIVFCHRCTRANQFDPRSTVYLSWLRFPWIFYTVRGLHCDDVSLIFGTIVV